MTTQLAIAKRSAKCINKTTPLALAIKLACGIAITLSANTMAQQPSANSQNYRIKASPLAKCLNHFAAQSGLFLSANAKLTQGKRCTGITGTLSVEQALLKLLKNTGLQAVKQNDGSYLLAPVSVTNVLATAQVTDINEETVYGSVDGYVARRSATGTKTDIPIIESPQSVSVITTDQIVVQKAQSLSEAFGYSAGIVSETSNNLTVDSFVIRGFRAYAGVGSLYRDGTKAATNIYDGNTEPYGLERLELLKGPSSVLYGKAAPGGIINMVTKRPTVDPIREVNIDYGSNNRKQVSGDFSDALTDDGVWSYRLTGLLRDSDTMIDYVDDDRAYIAPAITWRPDEATFLTLLANYQKNKSASVFGLPIEGTLEDTPNGKIPRNRFIGEPGYDKYETEIKSLGYVFEHQFNQDLTLRNNSRYFESDGDFPVIWSGAFDSSTGILSRARAQDRRDYSDVFTTDISLEYKIDTAAVSHTLLLGTDYTDEYHETERYNRTVGALNLFSPEYGVALIGVPVIHTGSWKEQSKSYGLYFQDQLKIQDKWVVSLGGRQDWTESQQEAFFFDLKGPTEKNDAFTGRAGLIYLADNGLAPYISYSESFQPQGGKNRSGSRFDPTTEDQYEMGVRYQPEGSELFITASIYELTQQNVLTTDPVDSQFNVQTGEIQSHGFELEVKTNIDDNTRLIAAYAYTDTEVTKDNNPDKVGNRVSGVPYNQFSLWGDYQFTAFGLSGLMVGAGMRYVGNTTSERLDVTVPDYTLFDAMVSYETEHWRYALNAKNLTDKNYVSCTYACFYGDERSLIVSASYNF